MQVSDFHFDLPDELIARYPQPDRTASRLLTLDGNTGALEHQNFRHILELIQPGDLMVFNNTRVIPARVFGRKASGGKIEVLVERVLDQKTILAHVRASKAPKPGTELFLGENDEFSAEMVARHDALFEIRINGELAVLEVLEQIGHMPLLLILTVRMKTATKSVTRRYITPSRAPSPRRQPACTSTRQCWKR